jgi:type II secretory pathway component PulF
MNDDALISRIEKFERTVATCFCVVPFLFAAQCFFAAIICPVFQAMFADFGSKLPVLTEWAIRTWRFWAVFAVLVPTAAIIVARKRPPAFALIFATSAGLVMFVVAQILTAALFLPILQLGEVAGGAK